MTSSRSSRRKAAAPSATAAMSPSPGADVAAEATSDGTIIDARNGERGKGSSSSPAASDPESARERGTTSARGAAGQGPRPTGRGTPPGGRGAGSPSASGGLEVRIGDTPVHRSPTGIARSLRYLLAGVELPGRLAVTSAIHGEGVTSISRTLAALIAHDWRTSTCWVDLNWWKTGSPGHESSLFDVTLADVVDGNASTTGLAVQTSIPDLSMVSAGEVSVTSRSRMPRSERLAATLDELSESFEYLVFDLPPVLASSDALTLGGLTDGYLLVVRQRSTSAAQVRAALRTMNTAPCLGSVLNSARSQVPRWLRTSNEVWALGERSP